jgi:hypothetical protein
VEDEEDEALPPADSVDRSDREDPDVRDGGRDDPAEDDSQPSGQVRRRGRSRRRKGRR